MALVEVPESLLELIDTGKLRVEDLGLWTLMSHVADKRGVWSGTTSDLKTLCGVKNEKGIRNGLTATRLSYPQSDAVVAALGRLKREGMLLEDPEDTYTLVGYASVINVPKSGVSNKKSGYLGSVLTEEVAGESASVINVPKSGVLSPKTSLSGSVLTEAAINTSDSVDMLPKTAFLSPETLTLQGNITEATNLETDSVESLPEYEYSASRYSSFFDIDRDSGHKKCEPLAREVLKDLRTKSKDSEKESLKTDTGKLRLNQNQTLKKIQKTSHNQFLKRLRDLVGSPVSVKEWKERFKQSGLDESLCCEVWDEIVLQDPFWSGADGAFKKAKDPLASFIKNMESGKLPADLDSRRQYQKRKPVKSGESPAITEEYTRMVESWLEPR
jgi:hypothetical protein